MGIPGPAPKENKRRRNIGPLDSAWVEVPNVPYAGPVPIKAQRSDHPNAKQWLKVVSTVPHAKLWRDDDWAYIAETLRIKDAFEKGNLKLEQALRSRYSKLGLTYEDRLKLRIRYVDPVPEEDATAEQKKPGTVTPIDTRRKRVRPVASD
jgi:hypothetical protein